MFLFVFSECGKKIVGDASGVGHSTGIESGPTEVGLFRSLYSPGYNFYVTSLLQELAILKALELKFIHSEKTVKFFEISTLLLTGTT